MNWFLGLLPGSYELPTDQLSVTLLYADKTCVFHRRASINHNVLLCIKSPVAASQAGERTEEDSAGCSGTDMALNMWT
jgi:hypothetical protein